MTPPAPGPVSPMAQVRAMLARLQSGQPLTDVEAERLALEALALRRRLERLRAIAPEVEVTLDPMLEALAEGACARRERLSGSETASRAAVPTG